MSGISCMTLDYPLFMYMFVPTWSVFVSYCCISAVCFFPLWTSGFPINHIIWYSFYTVLWYQHWTYHVVLDKKQFGDFSVTIIGGIQSLSLLYYMHIIPWLWMVVASLQLTP